MWRSSVIPESSIPAPWRRELQDLPTKLFMNQLVDKCARVRQHTRDGNGVRKHWIDTRLPDTDFAGLREGPVAEDFTQAPVGLPAQLYSML